jgi:nitrile hydratase accessory protein
VTPASLEGLPSLPRDEEGPVFREPWEAQAFALAVSLSKAGCFTGPEWAETLALEIRDAQHRGDPDLGDTYYQHWLRALERLCRSKGLVGEAQLAERTERWRRAYLNTPHGQPIQLAAGLPTG